MGIKNNAVVGHIECPLCHGAATVHSCMVGRGRAKEALYIRCGTVSNGCGCIQPYGPTGQQFIQDNYRPLDEKPEPKPEPAAEPVEDPAPAANADDYGPGEEGGAAEEKPRKRGFMNFLLTE